MSNPDSFIEEVTEEVRRDRLFAMFRKYGWIGGLVVVAIVGGAAYSEWQKAQALARAEGFGEAMLDALDIGGASERRAAMESVPADGAQLALRALMVASDPAEDKAAALAALPAISPPTRPSKRPFLVPRMVFWARRRLRRTSMQPGLRARMPLRISMAYCGLVFSCCSAAPTCFCRRGSSSVRATFFMERGWGRTSGN